MALKTDRTKLALIVLLVALSGTVVEAAQVSSKTYRETRKLLSEMKNGVLHAEVLPVLFRVGDERIGDLIQSLDDPETEVSLSAQIVIRYLGNEAGLKGLAEYYKKPRESYFAAGPTPITLSEFDYTFIKSNPSHLREEHIYALALDGSARAKELLASIARTHGNASAERLTAHALSGVKSVNPNRLLTGHTDLAELVLANAFFVHELDKKYASAHLIELNAARDKAAVEVYINRGVLAEEWWHVVISKHENGWKFFSISQAGIS
jgi:hypothetical protein